MVDQPNDRAHLADLRRRPPRYVTHAAQHRPLQDQSAPQSDPGYTVDGQPVRRVGHRDGTDPFVEAVASSPEEEGPREEARKLVRALPGGLHHSP